MLVYAPLAPDAANTAPQVIPTAPLLQHYTVDVDALLSITAKRVVPGSCAPACTSTNTHELFKALRGRQLDVATDAQLQQLVAALLSAPDSSTDAAGSKLPSDISSVAMLRLRRAAALYNANAARELSDDLAAAAESIRSTLCALHSRGSTAVIVT
jgi:hypothetical protein